MHISRRSALGSSAAAAAFFAAAPAFGKKDERPSGAADLARLDAVATAAAVRDGHLSALEAADAAIARAGRIDPALHAIVAQTFDAAGKATLTGFSCNG